MWFFAEKTRRYINGYGGLCKMDYIIGKLINFGTLLCMTIYILIMLAAIYGFIYIAIYGYKDPHAQCVEQLNKCEVL